MNHQNNTLLKERRVSKEMTQQQVADRAGLNMRHYQMFENGKREITNASFRLVMAVCDAMDIEPKKLLNN